VLHPQQRGHPVAKPTSGDPHAPVAADGRVPGDGRDDAREDVDLAAAVSPAERALAEDRVSRPDRHEGLWYNPPSHPQQRTTHGQEMCDLWQRPTVRTQRFSLEATNE